MCEKCVAAGIGESHRGKAATFIKDSQLTIITDCETCGRVTLGPIHVTHLRTVAHLMTMAGDEMGLPRDHGTLEQVVMDQGNDPNIVDRGLEQFEAMGSGISPKRKPSVWDALLRTGKAH